jgi:hypothetical protein
VAFEAGGYLVAIGLAIWWLLSQVAIWWLLGCYLVAFWWLLSQVAIWWLFGGYVVAFEPGGYLVAL